MRVDGGGGRRGSRARSDRGGRRRRRRGGRRRCRRGRDADGGTFRDVGEGAAEGVRVGLARFRAAHGSAADGDAPDRQGERTIGGVAQPEEAAVTRARRPSGLTAVEARDRARAEGARGGGGRRDLDVRHAVLNAAASDAEHGAPVDVRVTGEHHVDAILGEQRLQRERLGALCAGVGLVGLAVDERVVGDDDDARRTGGGRRFFEVGDQPLRLFGVARGRLRDVADEAGVVRVGGAQEDHVQLPHVTAVPAAAGIGRRRQVGVDLVVCGEARGDVQAIVVSAHAPDRHEVAELGRLEGEVLVPATDGGGDARVGDIVQRVAGRERCSRAAVLDPVAHVAEHGSRRVAGAVVHVAEHGEFGARRRR